MLGVSCGIRRKWQCNCMALIGRLFVIFFAFLAACFVAGMIVVGAVLFPEFTDLGIGQIDPARSTSSSASASSSFPALRCCRR